MFHRRCDGKLIAYVPYWTRHLFPGRHYMTRVGLYLVRYVEYRHLMVAFDRRFNAYGYPVER